MYKCVFNVIFYVFLTVTHIFWPSSLMLDVPQQYLDTHACLSARTHKYKVNQCFSLFLAPRWRPKPNCECITSHLGLKIWLFLSVVSIVQPRKKHTLMCVWERERRVKMVRCDGLAGIQGLLCCQRAEAARMWMCVLLELHRKCVCVCAQIHL